MENLKSTGPYPHKTRNWVLFTCLSGALAVALGAFGAHALEGQLSPKRAEVYSTANFYHFIHTLLLLAIYLLGATRGWNPKLIWAGKLTGVGLVLFSGSLYLLATRGLIGAESAGWLGAITPLGGLSFILAWILMGLSQTSTSQKGTSLDADLD